MEPEHPILKWPISARPLSDKEIATAKKSRKGIKTEILWESFNCSIARARYLIDAGELAEHLGVSVQYVYDTFEYDEWHHEVGNMWGDGDDKVYFYDPGNILNDLAKNEKLRLAIRQLAEIKHPNILTDETVYTGWEKRLYSRDGYRRHKTVGKFTIWKDIENSGTGIPNQEKREQMDNELREKIKERIKKREQTKENQRYLI